MREPEEQGSVIGIRTAVILFALLAVFALATLKGPALYLALLIVLGLAAKALVHHLRGRIE